MGVRLKFELGDKVYVMFQDKVTRSYVSSILTHFDSPKFQKMNFYTLAKTKKDLEERTELPWGFAENKIFATEEGVINGR